MYTATSPSKWPRNGDDTDQSKSKGVRNLKRKWSDGMMTPTASSPAAAKRQRLDDLHANNSVGEQGECLVPDTAKAAPTACVLDCSDEFSTDVESLVSPLADLL